MRVRAIDRDGDTYRDAGSPASAGPRRGTWPVWPSLSGRRPTAPVASRAAATPSVRPDHTRSAPDGLTGTLRIGAWLALCCAAQRDLSGEITVPALTEQIDRNGNILRPGSSSSRPRRVGADHLETLLPPQAWGNSASGIARFLLAAAPCTVLAVSQRRHPTLPGT